MKKEIKPLYWKNNVERIRKKLIILSSIPGNFLSYTDCHFLQDCLNDYADTLEKLQKRAKEEKRG